MVTRKRKDDWYRKPLDFGLVITILAVVASGAMWVQANDDKAARCEEGLQDVQQAITCIGTMKVQIATTALKIENVEKTLNSFQAQQKDDNKELRKLLIQVLQNGKAKKADD